MPFGLNERDGVRKRFSPTGGSGRANALREMLCREVMATRYCTLLIATVGKHSAVIPSSRLVGRDVSFLGGGTGRRSSGAIRSEGLAEGPTSATGVTALSRPGHTGYTGMALGGETSCLTTLCCLFSVGRRQDRRKRSKLVDGKRSSHRARPSVPALSNEGKAQLARFDAG